MFKLMKAAEQIGDDDAQTDVVALGRELRDARLRQHLSLEALAATSGVSTGSISQLERGRGNPSVLTLRRLAEALGLPLLLFTQGPASTGMVVRANGRKRLALPESELVYELLSPNLRGRLEVLRTTVPPGFSNEEKPFVHTGEECVHLLSGSLQVTVGAQRFVLDEGDAITYDPSIPHWWVNAGEEPAVMIGVVTPPSF